MLSRARFVGDVNQAIGELLSAHDFRAEHLQYWRHLGHVISCIDIQEHSSEPRCCVNLGIHLDFVPCGDGRMPHAPEMSSVECEIKRRLTPSGEDDDFWWWYEPGADRSLVAALRQHGLPFLQPFHRFPDYWTAISMDDLKSGEFVRMMPGVTRVRAALLLARAHAFLGNASMRHALAAYGMEIAPAMASGPRKALKELLAERVDPT